MPETFTSLCERCQGIDFDAVVNLDDATLSSLTESASILIAANLELSPEFLMNVDCALCQMFHNVVKTYASSGYRYTVHTSNESTWTRYELRAFSYLQSSVDTEYYFIPKALRALDRPTMALVPQGSQTILNLQPHGHILCQSPNDRREYIFDPKYVPPLLDYDLIGKWINLCRSHHKSLCEMPKVFPSQLKLIDCNSLQVQTAEAAVQYAALSYVWGAGQLNSGAAEHGGNDGSLADHQAYLKAVDLPKTISDAITVTKNLGLRYLWVDKFCIDQENPSEKHHQINQMDDIYARADICLIAASGEDETFGLSGVSYQRKAQHMAISKGKTIIHTMAHPHHNINRSRWSTRGWTYQEAVLARRRLVFTEDRFYFECNAMNCYEHVEDAIVLLMLRIQRKPLLKL